MSYEAPAIVKLAESLLLQLELVVARMARYDRHSTGADLKKVALSIAVTANVAALGNARQGELLEQLSWQIDTLKVRLRLARRLNAISTGQLEAFARMARDLGRQCGGWQKANRCKGQNAPDVAGEATPAQRAQILSSRGASIEAQR